MFGLGLGLGVGMAPAGLVVSAAFSIQFTGTPGEIGSEASFSYTISPDNGTETVKWSLSSDPSDPANFGTGANPTSLVSGDGQTGYLHVTDGGETVTRSFPIRYPAPTVATLPQITGQPTEGETLSGTAGVFAGDNITDQRSEWQSSPNGSNTWTDTDDTDLTSPAQVRDLYYRLRSFATNSGGTTEAFSNVIGPAVAPAASDTWSITPGLNGTFTLDSTPPPLTASDQGGGQLLVEEAA